MGASQNRETAGESLARLRFEWPGTEPRIIELESGPNRIGRASFNQIIIDHPTISDTHCQIEVTSAGAVLRDLGSTNGTFVNGELIQQVDLQSGQLLQLGDVQFTFEQSLPPVDSTKVESTRSPLSSVQVDSTHCANHVHSRAVWTCTQCHRSLCAACVRQIKLDAERVVMLCKSCDGLCERIGAGSGPDGGTSTFWVGLLDALCYPFKGPGIVMMIAGGAVQIVLTCLGSYFLLLGIGFSAYFSVFMRNIILSSANGDKSLPAWPDFDTDNIRDAAFQFLGVGLVSFGPSILANFWIAADPGTAKMIRSGLWVLGALYFPMALLAVVIYDNLAALNPLLVLLSIGKTAGRYAALCVYLGVFAGLNLVIETALSQFAGRLVASSVSSLGALYATVVAMRVMGWFYYCSKEKLAWK